MTDETTAAWSDAPPPRVEQCPTTRTVHGVELVDDYAWLRAGNWRDVLRDPAALPADIRAVLEAENAHAARHLEPLAHLVATLKAELRGRIEEDDASVPQDDGPWHYLRRYRDGGQYPVYCRTAALGEEEVLLDGDREGADHAFFSLGEVSHAPDHDRLAWSADTKGSELFTIRVRDLTTGTDLDDQVPDSRGGVVWRADSRAFYYVRVGEDHRASQVFLHEIGSREDRLVYEEKDPAWFVDVDRTSSGAFAVISVTDHAASECHLIDLADPSAVPRCIEPRAPDRRYSVAHAGEHLFIRTNADDAEDFKIVRAPLSAPSEPNWVDVVPHRRGRIVVAMSVFPEHLVRLEREDGLPRIVIRSLADDAEHTIDFAEEAYSLGLEGRLRFDAPCLRFTYSSMTTPRETWDYDLATHARTLRKRQTIPSGHDPARYVTRRLHAKAADGAEVPISLLHSVDLAQDGSAPLLLYGYGAYGHPMSAGFSANVLSLVDRGFIYAIAHVRGGAEKGWHWYLDGKLEKKPNTFGDFIAVAHHLIAAGYAREGLIVAQGGSAGGMLMGAIANLAPELFAGIVAVVPFVDVLNTMLDAELPLTPPEWLEWGNPIRDEAAFATIRAYSPYDNVAAQAYPPILALAGLTDPRVTYWEPAKWVAKLRATMVGGGPVILKTQMSAGHGGASGRFDRLGEIAEQYAFALRCANISV